MYVVTKLRAFIELTAVTTYCKEVLEQTRSIRQAMTLNSNNPYGVLEAVFSCVRKSAKSLKEVKIDPGGINPG